MEEHAEEIPKKQPCQENGPLEENSSQETPEETLPEEVFSQDEQHNISNLELPVGVSCWVQQEENDRENIPTVRHGVDDKFDNNNNYELPQFKTYRDDNKNSRDQMFASENQSSSDEKISEDLPQYILKLISELSAEKIEVPDEAISEDIQSSENGISLKRKAQENNEGPETNPNWTQNPKKYKRMRTQENIKDKPKSDLETQKSEIMELALSDSSDLDDDGCTSNLGQIDQNGYLAEDEMSSEEEISYPIYSMSFSAQWDDWIRASPELKDIRHSSSDEEIN